MMAMPQHLDTVEQVYAAGSWNLRTPEGCGTFVEAAVSALHRRDRRWGHLRKRPEQHNWNGHAHDGALYLSDTPGRSQFVDFIADAESTDPSRVPRIVWNPDEPRYSASDWYAPEAAAPSGTRLGCSLFWLLAGVEQYPAQLEANLRWVRDVLKADYVRAFGQTQGDGRHAGGPDPWAFAGIEPTATRIVKATDLCARFGLKVQWTIVASRPDDQGLAGLEALVDRFADALVDRLHHVELFDICNEYEMWNKMEPSEMRVCARRLRAQLPAGFPIALSTPVSMLAGLSQAEVWTEMERLHGGDSGANAVTPHYTRPDMTPWGPESDLGPVVRGWRRYNNEGPGPGASNGSIIDPAMLAQHFARSRDAGEAGYVYHALPGIWGGHCHPQWPNENRWPNFWDVPNAEAIAKAIHTVRAGGTVDTGGGGGGSTVPLPDRGEMMAEALELDRYYRSPEGLQRSQGLSIDGAPDWEGVGAWLFDVYLRARLAGKSREDARALYIKDIRRSAEWRQKHPGEQP